MFLMYVWYNVASKRADVSEHLLPASHQVIWAPLAA